MNYDQESQYDKNKKIEFFLKYLSESNSKSLLELLNTDSGRGYIMHIMDMSGVFSDNYTGTERDAYYQGRRSVGLEILKEINQIGMEAIDLKLKGEREFAKLKLEIDRVYSESQYDQ